MEPEFSIDQRKFRAIDNSSGLSGEETIFTYQQRGNLLAGEYKGGEIELGNIVGKFVSPNSIELLFQCRTKSNKLLSGSSKGIINKNGNGKLGISFKWKWLSGDQGSGNSYHEET